MTKWLATLPPPPREVAKLPVLGKRLAGVPNEDFWLGLILILILLVVLVALFAAIL